MCFYFDAKLGDEGTVDDCEYSGVDEVQQWIATHRRRLKAEAARRNGTKLKVATFQRKIRYLGYTFGDGSRGHARQQAAIVSDASKRVAARAYARVYLNVERGLWAWTMAARHHGEKFSAVWPRLDRDLSEYLEESQMRALVGILGEAAPPRVLLTKSGLRALLCGVFDLWPLSYRRWLDRLRYANSLPGACVMPWRKNVVAAFASEVGVNSNFASGSCSGALEDARTRLRKAEAKYGTGGTLSDSDASSDSDDDDPAGFRRQARAATCKAKAVIAKDVADWQATEMAGLESTRLFRAMAPSRSWLKGVRRSLMCDAAGLAPLALMCGVYWPCPETRAGDFSSRRCVCGRKSSRGSLTLHFCFGPCPCAVNSRAKWKQRVAEAFQRHGLSATAGGSTPTYALLARWLGNGGRELPKELALELPLIFADTFGVWSKRVPRSHVDAIFGL